MAYIKFTNNPYNRSTGDCVIRALSVALKLSWDDVFWNLTAKAYEMGDILSSNSVWGEYLKDVGFIRRVIPNSCPDCYTVAEFALDNPYGTYVLGTGTHAVAVVNGNIYDAWDSSKEVPIYYYEREV
jgi:hypothetical protein